MKAKHLLITALAAALCVSSALAEENDITSSITSLVTRAAPPGKLATQTEILAERAEAAMLTVSSPQTIDAAIAMYEHINQRGGWPNLSKRLEKGDKSGEVVLLRQRLAFEG